MLIISVGETGSTGGAKEGRSGKGAPPLGKEDKEKKQTSCRPLWLIVAERALEYDIP